MKKNIAVIGIVGIPAQYGGFETFADYLSRYINNQFTLTVYCSSKSYRKKMSQYEKAKLKYIALKATGAQSIPYDILSILTSFRNNNTLLILGSSGAIILPLIKVFSKTKIVFNMAGLEWKRSKWNKPTRKFLKFSEKIAVTFSDEVVVDNKGLQEYITSEYGVNSTVIAYGGDQATKKPLTKKLLEKFTFLEQSYYAAVARIQPDNNIDIILEAFENMPDTILVFIGNWNASTYGSNLKNKYLTTANIHCLDPIYELDILDQIRSNCTAYIHGHSSGGTNPSLVEAMHLEVPIIAFDVNFNHYTTQNKAVYFKDHTQLINIIRSFDLNIQQQKALEMKQIANKLYKWQHIVSEYEKLF